MSIFERAKELVLCPRQSWQTIKEEAVEIKPLFVNYAAPLALIPTLSSLIGITLVGIRFPAGQLSRAPFFQALLGAAVGYAMNLAAVLAAAWAVKLLAPAFRAKADLKESAKVVVYAMTPVWLVGLFSLVPNLGILSLLGLYGVYLLYLGLEIVLETPADKRLWFTGAVLLAGLVISFFLSIIMVGAFYGPMYLRMMAY